MLCCVVLCCVCVCECECVWGGKCQCKCACVPVCACVCMCRIVCVCERRGSRKTVHHPKKSAPSCSAVLFEYGQNLNAKVTTGCCTSSAVAIAAIAPVTVADDRGRERWGGIPPPHLSLPVINHFTSKETVITNLDETLP